MHIDNIHYSCLLACILLAYWLLIMHMQCLILHDHILDPFTLPNWLLGQKYDLDMFFDRICEIHPVMSVLSTDCFMLHKKINIYRCWISPLKALEARLTCCPTQTSTKRWVSILTNGQIKPLSTLHVPHPSYPAKLSIDVWPWASRTTSEHYWCDDSFTFNFIKTM